MQNLATLCYVRPKKLPVSYSSYLIMEDYIDYYISNVLGRTK